LIPGYCHDAEKPASGKLGIHFYWGGRRGDRVRVAKVKDDSPLKDSPIKVGQIVLALNSVVATTALQASNLIKESGPIVSFTTLSDPSAVENPFCKLVSAPTSRQYPGIKFDSTRDRCLVQISRVFPHGPFAGTDLHQGDIVLAVNGEPVSTPSQAEKLLQGGPNKAPYTVLYVVDMSEYRQSILQELQVTPIYHDIALEKGDSEKEMRLKLGENTLVKLELDFNSQHLVDHEAHLQVASLPKSQGARGYNQMYTTVVMPFMEAFNDGIEKRMEILEEAVNCEVWQSTYMAEPAESTHNITLATSAGDRRPRRQEEDQYNNSSQSCSSATIDDAEIPIAPAIIVTDLEVFPMGVLQTCVTNTR